MIVVLFVFGCLPTLLHYKRVVFFSLALGVRERIYTRSRLLPSRLGHQRQRLRVSRPLKVGRFPGLRLVRHRPGPETDGQLRACFIGQPHEFR